MSYRFLTSLFHRPYADWLDFVLNKPTLPYVISTSYGDDEQTGMLPIEILSVDQVCLIKQQVPKSYAERVCKGFAQLGTVTIISITIPCDLKTNG